MDGEGVIRVREELEWMLLLWPTKDKPGGMWNINISTRRDATEMCSCRHHG
jgi:hypothetical protein